MHFVALAEQHSTALLVCGIPTAVSRGSIAQVHCMCSTSNPKPSGMMSPTVTYASSICCKRYCAQRCAEGKRHCCCLTGKAEVVRMHTDLPAMERHKHLTKLMPEGMTLLHGTTWDPTSKQQVQDRHVCMPSQHGTFVGDLGSLAVISCSLPAVATPPSRPLPPLT